jgi:hypothetical protein
MDLTMHDGWKTPQWDDTLITIPRRILQECELAMSDSRGMVQRLECLPPPVLDARDKRAIGWGREALSHVRAILYPQR